MNRKEASMMSLLDHKKCDPRPVSSFKLITCFLQCMQLIFKNLNTGDKNQDSVMHTKYAWNSTCSPIPVQCILWCANRTSDWLLTHCPKLALTDSISIEQDLLWPLSMISASELPHHFLHHFLHVCDYFLLRKNKQTNKQTQKRTDYCSTMPSNFDARCIAHVQLP